MKTRIFNKLIFAFLLIFSACASYKQGIMFKTDEGNYPKDLEYSKLLAERNYKIQINDKLDIKVYTNEGERVIDPDYELQKDMNTTNVKEEDGGYFVQMDGTVKVPMIGSVKLENFTTMEAESLLETKFSNFYKDPYIIVKFKNKRVVVLGATGGQVIPLENEDMSLLEVLALAGGLPNDSKAQNIRLIRGDLNDPEVQIIDLSTIEGMMQADLKIYSGDIIYVEPVIRAFTEGSKDILPLLSVLTSLIAIILAISVSR